MNENSRMYLYIQFCSVRFYSFSLFKLAIAHAFDWSTINTSFMDFRKWFS